MSGAVQGNLVEHGPEVPGESSLASGRAAVSSAVTNSAGTAAKSTLAQQLLEISSLHQSGALTLEEFQAAKARLLQM